MKEARPRQTLVVQLLRKNNAFKRHFDQHQELERRLRTLDRKIYLSSDEQTEVNRLKKLKLKHKDEMEAMLVNARTSPGT